LIGIYVELTNNKLPKNDSGGDGNSFENQDGLFHAEFHRTIPVTAGIKKNQAHLLL